MYPMYKPALATSYVQPVFRSHVHEKQAILVLYGPFCATNFEQSDFLKPRNTGWTQLALQNGCITIVVVHYHLPIIASRGSRSIDVISQTEVSVKCVCQALVVCLARLNSKFVLHYFANCLQFCCSYFLFLNIFVYIVKLSY